MNAFTLVWDGPMMQALGRTLLHFIWQGALLGALGWVALGLARRRTAGVRYVLACGLMLACAVAPVGTFLILQQSSMPRARAAAGTEGKATLLAAEGAEAAVSEEAVAAPEGAVPLATDTLEKDSRSAGHPVHTTPVARATPKTTRDWQWVAAGLETGARWATPVWLAGVVIMTLRLAAGWGRIQIWRRQAGKVDEAGLTGIFARLSGQFELAGKVILLAGEKIPGPLTLGWLKPVVLVPTQMVTGMPREYLEALLAHELAHVARHDYLANLAQSAIEVALFYHPAVWWLGAQVREIREECCDELALRAGLDRVTYARALETLASQRVDAELAAAASGGKLLNRIARVLGRPRVDSVVGARQAAWGLILTGIAILAVGLVLAGPLPATPAPGAGSVTASNPLAVPAPKADASPAGNSTPVARGAPAATTPASSSDAPFQSPGVSHQYVVELQAPGIKPNPRFTMANQKTVEYTRAYQQMTTGDKGEQSVDEIGWVMEMTFTDEGPDKDAKTFYSARVESQFYFPGEKPKHESERTEVAEPAADWARGLVLGRAVIKVTNRAAPADRPGIKSLWYLFVTRPRESAGPSVAVPDAVLRQAATTLGFSPMVSVARRVVSGKTSESVGVWGVIEFTPSIEGRDFDARFEIRSSADKNYPPGEPPKTEGEYFINFRTEGSGWVGAPVFAGPIFHGDDEIYVLFVAQAAEAIPTATAKPAVGK